MKRRISILFISIVMLNGILLSCGYGPAYADEGIEGNAGAGEGNEFGEGDRGQSDGEGATVSGDEADSVSKNETESVSGNGAGSVSEDDIPLKKMPTLDYEVSSVTTGKAGIIIIAEAYEANVALIQIENTAVGIRKSLYQADIAAEGQTEGQTMEDDKTEHDKVELDFTITANGRYRLHALDSDGDEGSCEIEVSEIPIPSMSPFIAEAEYNMSHHEEHEFNLDNKGGMNNEYGTMVLGGSNGINALPVPYAAHRYTVKTRGGGDMEEDALKKYGDWSMLRVKEKPDDFKAWFEPYAADGSPLQQPLENIVDLSDYKVDLFSADVGLNFAEVLGEKASPMDSGDVVIEGLQRREEKSNKTSGNERARITGLLAIGVAGITSVTSMVIKKHGFGFVRRRLKLGLK